MNHASDLSPSEGGLKAWESIRITISRLDTLVMTLLTQGTVLLFVALGVIFGNRIALGPVVTLTLGILLLVGTIFLFGGIVRYTMSLGTAVEKARELEEELFGACDTNPRCITHHLSKHPLAAAQYLGRLYYQGWALFLVIVAFVFVIVQIVLMVRP